MTSRLFRVLIPALAIVAAAEPALAQRAVARGGAAIGRPIGPAVPRPPIAVGRPPGGRPVAPYRPYYYPYAYRPYPYYGYGYGYPYPYGFSVGYGYPYGWGGFSFGFSFGYPYYGAAYPYAYGPYGYPYPYYGYPVTYGSLNIRGEARNAAVFVDSHQVGVADDFDGTFQHLNLTPGVHQIEIRRPSAEPVSFDVRINAGQTITYNARPAQ